MASIEPQPTSPPPSFQFTLRTLLLLFVVLGSSLAVFGGWGIVVFGLAGGITAIPYAAYHRSEFRPDLCSHRPRQARWGRIPTPS